MSEKAFLDIWEEFGCPKEILGSENSFQFLSRIQQNTNGLFIIDHFSMVNYDYLSDIEYREPFNILYWKNFEKYPIEDELEQYVFSNATYIYSLCNIQKLLFINANGHLFILVMPIVSSDKDIRKFLKITQLEEQQLNVDEYPEEFYTKYSFILEGKIHRCFSHHLPFYSFLIQPKEGNLSSGISTEIIMKATLFETKDRIVRVNEKMKTKKLLSDEIYECGNTLRRIMEYLLKYYMVFKGIKLPNDSYGHNLIGDLFKKLKKENSNLVKVIDQKTIVLANELSHDSGKIYTPEEILWFLGKVLSIHQIIERELSK
jgi:hypothetical protein